jgi:chromosome segregation ATPase
MICEYALSSKKTEGFDHRLYLKWFEASTEELLKIKKRVKNRIDDNEDAINASELSRRKKTADIRNAFIEIKNTFDSLENRLSNVGKAAISIGDQLEQIDKQRSRAADTKDLIQYFVDFKLEDSSRLDQLRQSGADGEQKCAIMTKRLMALGKELDIPGTEQVFYFHLNLGQIQY